FKDSAINTGNIGICIYEPTNNKYWYNYNSTHYFIPTSNTKLFTLYAGMKYLGDSLVGLKYQNADKDSLFIQPTADPTFLLSEFNNQPVYTFLKSQNEKHLILLNPRWQEKNLGYGWAWDDYQYTFMAERSLMPIYGNVVQFTYDGKKFLASTKYFNVENEISYSALSTKNDSNNHKFTIIRNRNRNDFRLESTNQIHNKLELPFVSNIQVISSLLKDTLKNSIFTNPNTILNNKYEIIHSQPTDSLFKPMMHRSDNFFAEQTLLMVSNEHLGYMNDDKIIDTILNTDLKDVPQKPKWVDGSGLSRYNLFTPQSFVYILNKMRNDFGFERLKIILPTGGEGTLNNYFKTISGNIYAKTGTLSNDCALSGFLITNKGKLLIFSILTNNYITSATPVRRAVALFLENIQKKY
ncbi:MAG: D-alanyl-D-alanine carboxypeptidase, partial [Ferruginibacter sp.]